MLDKNKKEIKAGDLVKLVGIVKYADGDKEKISKKTWVVGERDGQLDLPEASEGMSYLIVGSKEYGIFPDFLPLFDTIDVSEGSVPQNYRTLKDIEDKGWKKGDIIRIVGRVSKETLKQGWLEEVSNDIKNKHTLIVVDPIKLGLTANDIK